MANPGTIFIKLKEFRPNAKAKLFEKSSIYFIDIFIVDIVIKMQKHAG